MVCQASLAHSPRSQRTDDAPAVSAPVTKDEPTPAPAPAARGTAQKSRGGPAARGGKYYPRGGKPKDAAAPAAADDSEGQKKCLSIFVLSNPPLISF